PTPCSRFPASARCWRPSSERTNVMTRRLTGRGRSVTALLFGLTCVGCAVGPNYHRPDVAQPQEFRSQAAAASAESFAALARWDVFSDPALQSLINEALTNNNNLVVAAARIEQARGVLGVSRSQGLPQLNYDIVGGNQATFAPQQDSADAVEFSGTSAVLSAAW